MATLPPLVEEEPRAKVWTPVSGARLFYPGVAVLLLVLMFLGFREYYLHGRAFPHRPIAPPIATLVLLHGITMSAWVVLLLVQSLLVLNRRIRVHRALGMIGAALAVGMVVLGLRVGIESVRLTPPQARIWGLAPRQFLAVPLISILIFAGFVALGVWYRRRPAVHRPMMLLATFAIIPAAVSRIEPLSALYVGTVWETVFGPFFWTLVLGALLAPVKWLLSRSFDRAYALGYLFLVVSSVLILRLATTGAWDRFASFLLQ
jgi:hypothetical protein